MAPSADRNLLFGILALQMDFITRDGLVAAMNAWVLAETPAAGRAAHEQGASRPLIASCSSLWCGGTSTSTAATIAEPGLAQLGRLDSRRA